MIPSRSEYRKIILGGSLVAFGAIVGFALLQTVLAQSPTPAPVNVTATAASACAFNVTFKTPVDGYKYEYEISPDASFTPATKWQDFLTDANGNYIAGTAGQTLTITPPPNSTTYGYGVPPQTIFFTPSTKYYFHVRVYPQNGNKESDWSTIISSDTNQMPAPVKPVNVTGTWNDAAGRIQLSWDAGSQPSNFATYGGYDIYRAVSTNGGNNFSNFVLAGSQPAKQRFFYDVDVNATSSYEYYVQAKDSDAGCVTSGINNPQIIYSANSDPTVVIPVAPSNLQVDGTIYTTGPEIDISWKDNAKNEDSYEVWRSFRDNVSYGSSPVKIASANTKTFQDTDPTLQKGELYFYKVRACKSNGAWCSSFSNEISQRAPSDTIALTSTMTFVSGVSTGSVTHSWGVVDPTNDKIGSFVRTNASGVTVNVSCSAWMPDGTGNEYCEESGVPLGTSYTYTLTVKRKKSITKTDTLTATSNTDFTGIKGAFLGRGWGAYASTANATSGIGWISLNSSEASSPKQYSVWADSTGTLHGEAWASVTSATGAQSYGWVSFNEADLGGCTTAPCKAQLNADGSISGWARFIAGKTAAVSGGWDGWVSLRGATADGTFSYGTCFGHGDINTATAPDGIDYYSGAACKGDGGPGFSELTGLAWAGPTVGGWIMWNPDHNKSNTIFPTFQMNPPGPFTLAYREQKSFSATQASEWYVGLGSSNVNAVTASDVLGGNNSLGNVSPSATAANELTLYKAPSLVESVRVLASSTQNTAAAAYSVVNIQEPYTLSCSPVIGNSTSLNIWWKANYTDQNYTTYAAHTLSLDEVTAGNSTPVCASKTSTPGSGSCTLTGLGTNTSHTYELSTRYTKDGVTYKMPKVTCTTVTSVPPTSDAPSETRVFGHDASTIYVNWKDNTTTTEPYHFELQRITLTPKPSENVKVFPASADAITLEWTNITSSTPYRNYYERTSMSDASKRFDPAADPFLFLTDIAGSSNPNTNSPVAYTVNDPVNEATTYYYRLRACSSINNGDITPFYTQNAYAKNPNDIGMPSPVCSPYTVNTAAGTIIATTTPPYAPTNLTATVQSSSAIQLTWRDNSQGETGFEIFQNGTSIGMAPGNPGTGNVSFTASGLSPATSYDFVVKAYYDYTSPVPGRAYSDPSNTATGRTFIVLNSPSPAYATSNGFVSRFAATISDAAASAWKALVGPSQEEKAKHVATLFEGLRNTFGVFFEKTGGALGELNKLTSKLASMTGEFIVKNTNVASGDVLLDQYFNKFDASVSTPVYIDGGLSPDTVYMYRVRVVYDIAGGGQKTSLWDNLGAAKTLRDNGGPVLGTARPICMRNSYCDFSIQGVQSSADASGKRESSLQQCTVNADCRDVGRAGQTYQER